MVLLKVIFFMLVTLELVEMGALVLLTWLHLVKVVDRVK
jgi:hypothetical protein